MIQIENVTVDGVVTNLSIESRHTLSLDASGLVAIPALIDPHVHFRVPGDEYKEDWKTAASACLCGGITFVCDMPNNRPSVTTVARLIAKKKIIEAQLAEAKLPLGFGLYLGADRDHLDEISKAYGEAIGLKIFMGGSTGDLLLDDKKSLDEAFRRAADANLVVACHAEDEATLQRLKLEFGVQSDPAAHSKIRNREAAIIACKEAIELADKYKATLYLLHMSTKEELEIVREAKKRGVKIFAEVTPHHLFLSTSDYKEFGTLIQMNPPIRDKEDCEALLEGIRDGVVDTIGTDHAPHTLEEKSQPYGKAPSGIPGVDTLLPLLLDAVSKKLLTLDKVVELTSKNQRKLFSLPPQNDLVLFDPTLEKELTKEDLRTKVGWSPYCGRILKGWPIFTIAKGELFSCRRARGRQ